MFYWKHFHMKQQSYYYMHNIQKNMFSYIMNKYGKTMSVKLIHLEITKDKDLKCLRTSSETSFHVS